MSVLIDLTGQRFGRLRVIRRYGIQHRGEKTLWLCRCDCGADSVVQSGNLRRSVVKSCGCLKSEILRKRQTIHGLRYLKTYKVWLAIKDRCLNPKSKDWKYYGARGISVYGPWQKDFKVFHDYISTLPNYGEPGLSLDRTDNDGHYKPGNLRWADRKQQRVNSRSPILTLTHDGQTRTIAEWSTLTGIRFHTLYARLRSGWTAEQVVSVPLRKRER